MNNLIRILGALVGALALSSAFAQGVKQPSIVVIWGDDIGWQNVSAYGLGTMGYRTPNIDRIARRGRHASPTTTRSRPALPDAPHSSPVSIRSAAG